MPNDSAIPQESDIDLAEAAEALADMAVHDIDSFGRLVQAAKAALG